MKRRQLIKIEPAMGDRYVYMVAFRDTKYGVGVAYFANTEKEVIELVMSRRKSKPLQLSLW